jgi:hypothetical protein
MEQQFVSGTVFSDRPRRLARAMRILLGENHEADPEEDVRNEHPNGYHPIARKYEREKGDRHLQCADQR